MKAYVGVTDGDWSRFLAARPHLTEVNFWRPAGSRVFRALSPGEPFFFKSHHPHNSVVGGGFFSGFAQLRISEAWDLFREGNGVPDLAAMRRIVGRYRSDPIAASEDPLIGCVLIRDTVFFPADEPSEPPPLFAPNVVQGKGYDVADHAASGYFEMLMGRLLGASVEIDLSQPWHRPGPVFGDPRLMPNRLGQQSFKAVVLDAYGRRCAITGDRIQPVLQAAHIRPLPAGGEHRLDNGLLLRSDVHTLFDHGYLGVDPKYRLMVSPRLRAEFGNGEQFYARAGTAIAVPAAARDRPHRQFLEWHLDEVYQAA
ncbi:HNH endonuclease [Micromonospora chokoriensis]|uniref:Putative restriction endonuclease n=1 Tax=Micromonospora chokoriensis TaxID=356851 RepID=A0A1C4ZDB5_9ACTN|nr:HNH endonuclease [Micromonospora chokoriensis]SCF31000.1 putative restriction endonuclease [Micromonospora chokoriensis]